ncbi:MAG: hypothetical protein ACE361_09035 [Aureliella sp.]
MRRILTVRSTRLGLAASTFGVARAIALMTSIAVLFCTGNISQAQTLAEQLAPTATHAKDTPVSSAVAVQYGGESYRTVPASAIDASYSVLSDTEDSSVELASARGGIAGRLLGGRGRAYCPPVSNPCNPGCDVSLYVQYEALWLRREGDDFFSLSRNTFLPDFEFEWAGRYTIGQLWDCVNGWEAVYAGPFDWQRGATITGTGLQSNLSPSNGYSATDIDTFNNATSHTQNWRAQLHSVEINRKWWVWDVLSTMIGARYIDYEEDYSFTSTSAAGSGVLLESVDNQMIGLQIGADMQYPVSLRSNVGIRGKAGAYANFDERRALLNNNGTLLINSGDSDVEIAGLIEMGIYTNYHIVPSVRLFAGYEFWWMPGVATVPEQSPAIITPATGTTVFNDDDLFLHGASVGAQVLF